MESNFDESWTTKVMAALSEFAAVVAQA